MMMSARVLEEERDEESDADEQRGEA